MVFISEEKCFFAVEDPETVNPRNLSHREAIFVSWSDSAKDGKV
jgi:hypothetical protein